MPAAGAVGRACGRWPWHPLLGIAGEGGGWDEAGAASSQHPLRHCRACCWVGTYPATCWVPGPRLVQLAFHGRIFRLIFLLLLVTVQFGFEMCQCGIMSAF